MITPQEARNLTNNRLKMEDFKDPTSELVVKMLETDILAYASMGLSEVKRKICNPETKALVLDFFKAFDISTDMWDEITIRW